MPLDPDQQSWIELLIETFNRDNTKVSDWELNFFTDQIERWETYGADMRISPKQWGILDKIADKLKVPPRGQAAPSRADPPAGWDDVPAHDLTDDILF